MNVNKLLKLLLRLTKAGSNVWGIVSFGSISLKVRTEMAVEISTEQKFGPIVADWKTAGHHPASVEDVIIESDHPEFASVVVESGGVFVYGQAKGTCQVTVSADKRVGPDVQRISLAPINVNVVDPEADPDASSVSTGTVSLKPEPVTPPI